MANKRPAAVPPIESQRLSLRWMSPRFIRASLAGRTAIAGRALDASLPPAWPDEEARRRLAMRLDQMGDDPDGADWLLRGMVRRLDRALVGFINFHGPPDERGRAELGYTVFEEHRRQGYASEAAMAMIGWAQIRRGAEVFVVSVSPENEPSLRLAASLGFERVGSQIDEEDGLEWVFELKPVR